VASGEGGHGENHTLLVWGILGRNHPENRELPTETYDIIDIIQLQERQITFFTIFHHVSRISNDSNVSPST
jgi:hypothetical protein